MKKNVEVLSGLMEGDRVITRGRHRLYENRPIKVIKIED